MNNESKRASVNRGLSNIAGFFAAIMLIAAGAGFVHQCFFWLQHGYWTQMPLREHLHLPSSSWLGVQQIIDWLLDQSACLVAVIVGFGLATIAMTMADRADEIIRGEKLRLVREENRRARERAAQQPRQPYVPDMPIEEMRYPWENERS
jgi:hypothetical protein